MKMSANAIIRVIGHLLLHNRTKYVMARNRRGIPVCYNNSKATKWCLVGAIQFVAPALGHDPDKIHGMVQAVLPKQCKRQLPTYWDTASDIAQSRFSHKLTRYGLKTK